MPRTKSVVKVAEVHYRAHRRARNAANQEVVAHPLDTASSVSLRETEARETTATGLREYRSTRLGKIFLGNSLELLHGRIADSSVDLIMTSPPFGLVRKKDYGNVDAHEYVEWFKQFGQVFHRVLRDTGSLVIDIGGAWISGQPTRSLYHYELLLMLCKEVGFHLAQEFFWWNPAKLPTPAEWVTVRRIRVKDAVNCVWWLSKTPWPKASNKRVLVPYVTGVELLAFAV